VSQCALCNTQEKRIAVHLVFSGVGATDRFQQLAAIKTVVESEIGAPLEWHAPDDMKQKHVILRKNGVDPGDRESWPAQYLWLREKLERFDTVFRPRVLALQVGMEDDHESDDDVAD
jgi:hypothetical protein